MFKSALNGAVLYGSESWLCNDKKAAVTPILSAQKQLLAVRKQTCNDLVLTELSYPELSATVKEVQINMSKLIACENYVGSSAHFVHRLGIQAAKYIDTIVQRQSGYFRATSLEALRPRISKSASSKRRTYCEFNPLSLFIVSILEAYLSICMSR